MIRRLFCLLMLALSLTACKKEALPPVMLEPGQTEVFLSFQEGAAATCLITAAQGGWTLSVEGDGFLAEPLSGGAGETVVTITSTVGNIGKNPRALGSIRVWPERSQTPQEIEVVQLPDAAPRAFFMFFIGTSLQSFFDYNLQQALNVMNPSIPGDSYVVAFCRVGGVWQIVRLDYDPEQGKGVQTPIRTFPQVDRSDPAFITEVLGWMKHYFPAREYGLAIGGHGTGWLPVGYSVYGRSAFRSGFAEQKIATDGYPLTRYYGESGSAFDVDEIAGSLQATGIRFDYIIFDDCFMSNIETLYVMRNTARYILASPCEVMDKGFPYQYVIPALLAPEALLEDRLQQVCEKYYDFYLHEYDPRYPSGCVAMTDCGQIDALAAVSRQLFASGSGTCDPAQLQHYEGLSRHLFYDFRQYAEQIATDAGALENFRRQFDLTFPPACRFNTPSFYSWYSRPLLIPIDYYSGVTCSAPSDVYPSENRQTEWWQATH